MKQQDKISVLIPCYNAGKYIREAVDSILNQTYKNLEILLIDDGSKDDTKQIILEYAARDSRVVPIYNENNLGLIRTLNKGVLHTTGSFIARMDADDVSALNRLEELYNAFMQAPDLDVISAGYYFLSTESVVVRRAFPKATLSKALYFVSLFCTPVNHPCVMVRSGVFKENSFDETYIHSEDYEIFSRLLEKGYKFLNLKEPLYFLRVNPLSVSNKFETIQISTHTRISARNLENYFNTKYDFFQHKVMINRISFNVPVKLLLKSIAALEELKTEFIRKENADTITVEEIDGFLIEQKMDIFLQAIKYATWLNKFAITIILTVNLGLFLNSRGIRYFKSKLNFLSVKL